MSDLQGRSSADWPSREVLLPHPVGAKALCKAGLTGVGTENAANRELKGMSQQWLCDVWLVAGRR